jgi:hypothetical protein
MDLLRPDMTEKQVFQTLGLSRFQKASLMGGGPPEAHWESFSLSKERKLTLVLFYDRSGGSDGRLVRVICDGERWTNQVGQ